MNVFYDYFEAGSWHTELKWDLNQRLRMPGVIRYGGGYFDLIVCFGALHHIPNVSRIIGEFYRCSEKGGYVLMREPIISMGDWTKKRKGLTRRERGIPLKILRDIIALIRFGG